MDNLVVITDKMIDNCDPEKKILEPLGKKIRFCKLNKNSTESEVIKECQDAVVVLNSYAPITEKVLSNCPSLKLIVRYGVGVDNVDIKAATKHKIMVANIPKYGDEEVADHAISLMLTNFRQIKQFDTLIRNGGWPQWMKYRPILNLKDAILGIIGFGRIGRQVARKVNSAFEMKILAFDPYVSKTNIPEYVEMVDLDTLLKKSDVVTIHTLLTNETKNLINSNKFKLMKPNSFIINAARGGIINEQDLYKALNEKRIKGAALDVMEKEPPSKDNPLLQLENILLTPHISWYSEFSLNDVYTKGAEEARRFFNNESLENLVNKELLNEK